MSSSKDVFAMRREGMLDDAYAMAIDVVHLDPHDEWNIKALAWCLYDLIKRSVAQKDSIATSKYATHLSQIQIDEYDDVLCFGISKSRKANNQRCERKKSKWKSC